MQMLLSCLLLPYQLATSFMGMSGAGAAADVVSELEGSLVDLAGAGGEEEEEEEQEAAVVEGDGEKEEQAIMKEADEREPSRVQEPGRSATGSWQHAAAAAQDGEMGKATATASKGKKKRLKREAFLARVRARSTSSTVKSGEHLREAAIVGQFSSQEKKQALRAWSTPPITPRHEPPRKQWPSPGDQVMPFQNETVAAEVQEVEGVGLAGAHVVHGPTVPAVPRVPAATAVPSIDAPVLPVVRPAGDEKRRDQLKVAFAKFDTDGSGSLDVEELAQVLCMGGKLTKAEALEKATSIIGKYDFDGNGSLDIEEFIVWSTAANAAKQQSKVQPALRNPATTLGRGMIVSPDEAQAMTATSTAAASSASSSSPNGPRGTPSVDPDQHLSDDEDGELDKLIPPRASSVAPAGDEKRRDQLKVAFSQFDTDGSGSLDVEELAQVLCMGGKLTKAEALEKATSIIGKYDFDGNGSLDIEEFIVWSTAQQAKPTQLPAPRKETPP